MVTIESFGAASSTVGNQAQYGVTQSFGPRGCTPEPLSYLIHRQHVQKNITLMHRIWPASKITRGLGSEVGRTNGGSRVEYIQINTGDRLSCGGGNAPLRVGHTWSTAELAVEQPRGRHPPLTVEGTIAAPPVACPCCPTVLRLVRDLAAIWPVRLPGISSLTLAPGFAPRRHTIATFPNVP